jgi:zeaxanthin glucosyltransferase
MDQTRDGDIHRGHGDLPLVFLIMSKILFLMYHGRGHFNAVFRLARILTADHEVVFAGYEYFRKDVTAQDFTFHGLKTLPFALGFEQWVNQHEKKKHVYWHSLLDRLTQRIYHLRENELRKLLDELDPKIVLIDAWQSTDFVVLYPMLKARQIKIALLQTMLPTVAEKDLPPLNSPALPGDTKAIRASHKTFSRALLLKDLKERIKFLGRSNGNLLWEKIRSNHMPASYYPANRSLFAPSFRNVDQLVLAPAEFQFGIAKDERTHYIGFMPDLQRKEAAEQEFENVFRAIIERVNSGLPMIYCSFGTVTYEHGAHIELFLSKLVGVLLNHNSVCIISCSDEKIRQSFNLISDNLYFFNTVPQLKVLSKAALFISHGGLNSIKEAIYHGVPLLIYPVSDDVDHKGNAARVFYHGLGLRGVMEDESQDDIERKITELLSNPVYKRNLDSFRQKDLGYTAGNVRKIFSRLGFVD